MSQVSDGQDAAVVNAKADAADDNNTGSVAIPVQPVGDVKTETFVSGTAQQLSASKDKMLYINITTAAALAVTMGPTSAGTGCAISVSQSSALGVISVRVPKGWYVKITGTVGDIVTTSVTV